MKKNLIFALLALILLTPWPVAYAHETTLAGAEMMHVEVVPADSAAAPSMKVFGGAIGGVTPGALFHIDSTENSADSHVTLHITNADELVNYYKYMTLEVGIYVQTGEEEWERVTLSSGEAIPETYITMRNGMVNFNLPGSASYKVTIDGGCFYCYSNAANDGAVSPSFYLTVE